MSRCSGAHGAGTQFTYAQLEGLWIKAGGPKRLAPTMAAVAMAESGGCSAAENAEGPPYASGLWQIKGLPFPGDVWDPATNAKMAVTKYNTQGLGAWVTYTSGAYRQFMNNSTTPDTNVPGPSSTPGTADTQSIDPTLCAIGVPVFGSLPIIGNLGGQCLLSKTQLRAGVGAVIIGAGALVLGAGLAVLAVYGLGRNRTVQTVVSLIPGGGAAAGMARTTARGARAAGAAPAAPATAAAAA